MSFPEIGHLARPHENLGPVFWVGLRLAGSRSRVIQELSPQDESYGRLPVGGSIRLRSNRLKCSTESPLMWSELTMVAKLAGITSDYFTLEWKS